MYRRCHQRLWHHSRLALDVCCGKCATRNVERRMFGTRAGFVCFQNTHLALRLLERGKTKLTITMFTYLLICTHQYRRSTKFYKKLSWFWQLLGNLKKQTFRLGHLLLRFLLHPLDVEHHSSEHSFLRSNEKSVGTKASEGLCLLLLLKLCCKH